jgi:hypothetical protein
MVTSASAVCSELLLDAAVDGLDDCDGAGGVTITVGAAGEEEEEEAEGKAEGNTVVSRSSELLAALMGGARPLLVASGLLKDRAGLCGEDTIFLALLKLGRSSAVDAALGDRDTEEDGGGGTETLTSATVTKPLLI